MASKRYEFLFSAALCGLLLSCGTIDRRVDPDAPDEVGGPNLRSQDIRAMADRMAREIRESGVLRSSDPAHRVSFHISSLRNDSSDPIDRELILLGIRTRLQQKLGRQVRVLDRSTEAVEEIREEKAAKRAAAVTANPNLAGALAGSDYVLKGTIKDRTLQSDELRSVYYVVTFELTDLETSELVWSGVYEAKFLSEKSVISR